MKKRTEQGRFTEHGRGLGTVTDEMVAKRAREIANINGRSEHQLLDSDFAQARRELTGKETLVPNPSKEEQLPEEERWDPVPGSAGKKVPNLEPSDEQTFAERLVEEGVGEAEQDQMAEAARESRKRSMHPIGPAKPKS